MVEPDEGRKIKQGRKHDLTEQAQLMAAAGAKPAVYDIISLRLRSYFDELAKQPVPDRFLALLDQLDAKISSKEDK